MITPIFNAVKAALEDVLKNVGDPIPSHELGAAELATMSSPPQIVWVLMGGSVGPARQQSAGGRREIREIYERHERCLVHIWGGDIDKTEILMNHFVAAARATMTGAHRFKAVSTSWITGQAQRTALGRVCILEIEFDVPFTAEPLAISKPPHHLTLKGEIIHPS